MFVFGSLSKELGGTMAASNSYLSSQIKDAKTLGAFQIDSALLFATDHRANWSGMVLKPAR